MADGVDYLNITRAMSSCSVNALQATSVVGLGAQLDSEFRVTRITNHNDKTSGGRKVNDHRGTSTTGNRGSYRQADDRS